MAIPLVDFHGALDLRLYQLVNRDAGPLVDAVMRGLSSRTFGAIAVLVLALALAARLGRRAWPALLALALAFALSDAVGSQVLRPLVARMRPCYALPPGTFRQLAAVANGPSLPSLHASNAFAVALAASIGWRALAVPAYALGLAVAFSRVYLGVHWPTDVLAGMVWGTIAALVAWAIARVVARRLSPGARAGCGPRSPAPP